MPLVGTKEILVEARKRRYGVLSLLAGDMEMVIGQISAAEEMRASLILAFRQEVIPLRGQDERGTQLEGTLCIAQSVDSGGSAQSLEQPRRS